MELSKSAFNSTIPTVFSNFPALYTYDSGRRLFPKHDHNFGMWLDDTCDLCGMTVILIWNMTTLACLSLANNDILD
jgi:hypothetical protein